MLNVSEACVNVPALILDALYNVRDHRARGRELPCASSVEHNVINHVACKHDSVEDIVDTVERA